MRRARVTLLAAFVVGGGLFLVHVALWRPLPVAGALPPDGFTRASGVVHVHTTASDGGGTPDEVVAAARAAGLDFVAITDHNTLAAKALEGRHDGTLVIVGTEISTTAGHVLGLGVSDPAFRFSGDFADALDDVRALGGVSFAAHPESPLPAFRWAAWDAPGAWGVELLNGDSEWRTAGAWRLARTASLYALNPRYALLGSLTPPTAMLARWDALLAQRAVPGIAGADAHSRLVVRKSTALRFPSYESLFALARNHVLLTAPLGSDAASDARRIVEALGRGRSYVGLDALADARQFAFDATSAGDRWTMGDVAPSDRELTLKIAGAFPSGARVRLLRDGAPLTETVGRLEIRVPGPGVYRVEVRVPGWDVPWIVSNPIGVFDATAQARREARAAWPPQAAAPPAAEILDAFEGGATIFEANADTASEIARPLVDPHAGFDGGGAARLAFRLGTPAPGHGDVFCALVDRRARDLSGRAGLVFRVRADGVYRMWLQVRDANPASADEGTEWWFASIRTSTEWRRIAVPFARLRSINPKTDGRLDLDKVRALVFVLDKGSIVPGTRGTLWLDDLGAY